MGDSNPVTSFSPLFSDPKDFRSQATAAIDFATQLKCGKTQTISISRRQLCSLRTELTKVYFTYAARVYELHERSQDASVEDIRSAINILSEVAKKLSAKTRNKQSDNFPNSVKSLLRRGGADNGWVHDLDEFVAKTVSTQKYLSTRLTDMEIERGRKAQIAKRKLIQDLKELLCKQLSVKVPTGSRKADGWDVKAKAERQTFVSISVEVVYILAHEIEASLTRSNVESFLR